MTEKDKMLSQMLYDANNNKALIEERARAKDMCFAYNNLPPNETQKQIDLLKKLLGVIKGELLILAPFFCDYGYNIEVGNKFFASHNTVILDCAKVKFGDNVFIAPNCGFYTAGHPIDAPRRNKGLEYAYPITVGNNVWFGGNVHVLPGVKIGNNVVIGAGSLVTKDIPDNMLAYGNPCRIIRTITQKDTLYSWDNLQ